MAAYVPPGWPAGVHPPGSEDFERTAQAWLLDTVPPDYRLHGVLRRYPLALAAMAAHHAKACVAGAREGYRTARTELGEALPPHALEAVLAAYRAEGRRLVATAQAVDLVARALRGEVFTPQLQETSPPNARRGPPGAGPEAGHGTGAAPEGRRPGTGPGAEDPRQADQPSAVRPSAVRRSMDRGSADQRGTDQRGAERAAPERGASEDQGGARRITAGPGTTQDQLSARRKAADPGTTEDQLSARRKAAGNGAESPADRPARDGSAKAKKAPASQRPARNGGPARRKARPSDKQAAAG
jgi:hypothetical protein